MRRTGAYRPRLKSTHRVKASDRQLDPGTARPAAVTALTIWIFATSRRACETRNAKDRATENDVSTTRILKVASRAQACRCNRRCSLGKCANLVSLLRFHPNRAFRRTRRGMKEHTLSQVSLSNSDTATDDQSPVHPRPSSSEPTDSPLKLAGACPPPSL